MHCHGPAFPVWRRRRLSATSLVVGLILSTCPDQHARAGSEVRLQTHGAPWGQTSLSIAPSELTRFEETWQSSFEARVKWMNRDFAWTQATPRMGMLAAAETGSLANARQVPHSGPALLDGPAGENFSVHLDHADVQLQEPPLHTLTDFGSARPADALPEGSVFRSWLFAQNTPTQPPAGTPAAPQAGGQSVHPEHADLGEIGNKLANPLSNLWSLQFSFNAPQFYDGDLNTGDAEVGGGVVFQPVAPLPLYGRGEDEWKIITRPIIPIVFSQPIPTGFNRFSHKGGIGDIQLPLLLNPSQRIAGNFILGAGPVFRFPSATSSDLGLHQWAMGPAVVVGYKTKKITLGVFPNYFWKIGSAGQGNRPDLSQGSLLYFFNYALPDAWQVGTNPTISYNDRASSGNKWNVPIGPYIGKTIRVGRLPLNIRVAVEYSVVSPDDFGQRFQFRLLVTPVVPSLIQNSLFGG